jgi:small multidrug resistance pump
VSVRVLGLIPGAWALLSVAIVMEVVGTTALKASHGFSRLVPSLLVLGAYCTAFVALGFAVRHLDIGLVYAIWSGIGTAAIAAVGVVAFSEPVTRARIAGMALIVVGVIVLNRDRAT